MSVVGRDLPELLAFLANIVILGSYLFCLYINTVLPPWGYQCSTERRWPQPLGVLVAWHQGTRLPKGLFPSGTCQPLEALEDGVPPTVVQPHNRAGKLRVQARSSSLWLLLPQTPPFREGHGGPRYL